MTTIKALRQVGFRAKVYHLRYVQEDDGQIYLKTKSQFKPTDKLLQKGGETRLDITDLDGQFDYEAAICRPDFRIENGQIIKQKGDPYNRKLGVKIALGRYLKRNGLSEKNILKGYYYAALKTV